eukprot:TRINITY_DN47743_c0_g1_i1.p1 TRINITY_DN47743_c0_g1~~TRINITY_DN47743_c0_g1_i1.p1  ORF type:complete len:657 (+),score=165.39 TRINITY_DN47743_c0_g1_i1:49-1971(+)
MQVIEGLVAFPPASAGLRVPSLAQGSCCRAALGLRCRGAGQLGAHSVGQPIALSRLRTGCTLAVTAVLIVAPALKARSRSRCRPRHASCRLVRVSMTASSDSTALRPLDDQLTDPTDEELQELFELASEGRDVVTFEEALSLDGVDGVLEEEAATVDELQVLWGDARKSLDLEAFSVWYCDVLKLYDQFLWQDAVGPPEEAFEDEQEDLRNAPDEQLLEDSPSMGVKVQDLKTPEVPKNKDLKFGTLTETVPTYERYFLDSALDPDNKNTTFKTQAQIFAEQQKKLMEESGPVGEGVAAPTPEGRSNVEITQLFRQACDVNNLLSYDALKQIVEIQELLEEDMEEKELEEIWDAIPKRGVNNDKIDVLGLRDLLAKIDEIFEYVPEDEEDEEDEESYLPMRRGRDELGKVRKRNIKTILEDLLEAVRDLQEVEKKPCGLDGREETDGELIKLAGELEDVWRDSVGELSDYDAKKFIGDWELMYSTSIKFRRWEGLMNPGRCIRNGVWEALVENFSVSFADDFNEYDIEEVFQAPTGEDLKGPMKELCVRGQGSWKAATTQNVVTGEEDLLLKKEMTAVEYDTVDGGVETDAGKIILSQPLRTACYSFLCFMDDDYRVMRTGYTGRTLFIWKRIKEDEDED